MSLATKAHHNLQHQVKITHSTDNIIAFCQHLNHHGHLSCTPRVLKGNFSSSTNYKPIRWPGSTTNPTSYQPTQRLHLLKAHEEEERLSREMRDRVEEKEDVWTRLMRNYHHHYYYYYNVVPT